MKSGYLKSTMMEMEVAAGIPFSLRFQVLLHLTEGQDILVNVLFPKVPLGVKRTSVTGVGWGVGFRKAHHYYSSRV